jgi:ankyrin repeat protein
MPHPLRAVFTCALGLAAACLHGAEPPSPAPRGWAKPSPAKKIENEVLRLIDQLTEMGERDVRYSDWDASGNPFFPVDFIAHASMRFRWGNILQREPPARTDVVRELAKHGAAALPGLIAHLNDRRPTQIKLEADSGLWLSHAARFDRNERTEGRVPGKEEKAREPESVAACTLTVGDLCFLSIGQIVNRDFYPVHCPNIGRAEVCSPVLEAELRDKVQRAWGAATVETHRASLIADFLKPDSDRRRVGAYKRLAYYYPEAIEPLLCQFVTRKGPAGESLSDDEWRGLILERLVCDQSPTVDRAYRDLLASIKQDDALADACLRRLIGRGYDADIEKYCRRRLEEVQNEFKRYRLQYILDRIGFTPLHVAVERGDRDVVRRLLRGNPDVNAADCTGTTPLHLAADGGDIDLVQELLAAGAALDPKDRNGETPVQHAICWVQLDVAELLIRRGCAIPDVATATVAGRADLIERLAKKEPKSLKAGTHDLTPLHLAAYLGRTAEADALLAAGAEVNVLDSPGWTPLHLAAAMGSAGVARALICAGADVRAKVGDRAPQPIHLAAERGHARIVALLLAARAPIDQKWEWYDATPLHRAAANGHAEVVELLLKRGADKEARGLFNDSTPLHAAAAAGKAEIVKILLAAGAAVDACNSSGETPLHLAREGGWKEAAALLEKARAKSGD